MGAICIIVVVVLMEIFSYLKRTKHRRRLRTFGEMKCLVASYHAEMQKRLDLYAYQLCDSDFHTLETYNRRISFEELDKDIAFYS